MGLKATLPLMFGILESLLKWHNSCQLFLLQPKERNIRNLWEMVKMLFTLALKIRAAGFTCVQIEHSKQVQFFIYHMS